MARKYTKIDYDNFDASNYTEAELRKIIDTMASAVNARLKTAKTVKGWQGSTFGKEVALIEEQAPEYFNVNGKFIRQKKAMPLSGLRAYADRLADLMTTKQTKKEFKEWDESDDFHKALSNLRQSDPDKFRRIIDHVSDSETDWDETHDGSPDDATVEAIKEVYQKDFTKEDYEKALDEIDKEAIAQHNKEVKEATHKLNETAEEAEARHNAIERIKNEGTEVTINPLTGVITFKK